MKKTHGFVILLIVVLTLLLLRRCQSPHEATPPQVSFVLPAEGAQVGRDYNQRVFVSLKNSGPGSARLRLEADPPPDLPSGFVGRGTEDWEVPDTVLEVPVGEIWEVPLLVHANRAQKDDYELPLHATHLGQAVAAATLKLHIAKPKLELETTWLEPLNPADRARLQSVLRIRNTGAPIPDLSVHFEKAGKPADSELHWSPVVESARLVESESTDVILGPLLYPGFVKLEGEIVIRGLNQELRLPYVAQVPDGKAVFITLSRTTSVSTNSGTRCTNTPSSNYEMPPTGGTPGGGHKPGGSGGGGSSGGGGGGSGGGGGKPSPPPPAPPKKDNDGFGFLGFDPPIQPTTSPTDSPPKPDTPSVTDGKDKKDKPAKNDKDKDKSKTDVAAPTPTKPATPALPTTLGDVSAMAPLMSMNDGLMANMNSNTRGATCGTMTVLDNEERMRLGLPPRPQPPDTPDNSWIPPMIQLPPLPDVWTRKDEDQPTTTLVKRQSDDGTDLLDFDFGIQDGERLRVPIRMKTPIAQPSLGPSPVKKGPALAAYTRQGVKGGTVAEVLDPASGKKIPLSPPDKKSDTPVVVRNQGGVDAIHRQDGVLQRTQLKPDLSTVPSTGWPAGIKTGPIISAETRPDGRAVLLTRDAGRSVMQTSGADRAALQTLDVSKITLRQPEGLLELPGTDAALAFSGKVGMVALRQSDGSLSVVDAATGETRHTVPGSGHGAPSLMAMPNGGMRLSFLHPMPPAESLPPNASGYDLGGHFAVDYKDGQWGAPRRLFMPDEPVRNAAVAVEFTPPFAQAHYKPMDIGLAVNNRKIAEVKGRTPSGRYLYRVPVSQLNYRTSTENKTAGNRVTIASKGIGPGNFHYAQKCSLYSLHDWKQGCFVASTPQEADQFAQLTSHDVRHRSADLVLTSNGTELPRSLQPGQSVEMQVGVFNAGDRPSKPVTLQAIGNDEKNGSVEIPALEPFNGIQSMIPLTAPKNWTPGTPLRLSVAIPVEDDSDPSTNRLDFYLFRNLDPAIAGPTRASGVDVKALPAGSIVEVPAGVGKDKPFESAIRSNRIWLRSPIPSTGDLQMSVTGRDAALVDIIDLFDSSGRILKPQSGHWPAYGTHVYLRIGLPDGASLGDDTRLKLWWE